MKKLCRLPQVIAATALVLISICQAGCDTTSTTTEAITSTATDRVTSTVTETVTSTVTKCVSSTMPSDFYIIYEHSWDRHNWRFAPLLDTKNNAISTRGIDYSIDFYIPCEDLQTIYDAIIAYDIPLLSGPDVLTDPNVVAVPQWFHRLTFCLEGVVYSVSYDNAIAWPDVSKLYPDLTSFHSMLDDYYRNTDEYESLPPSPGFT